MIELIVLAVVVAWFAKTSNQFGEHPLIWGLIAAASFVIPSKLVGSALSELLQDSMTSQFAFFAIPLAITIASIAAGLVVSFFARNALLKRRAEKPSTSTDQSPSSGDE